MNNYFGKYFELLFDLHLSRVRDGQVFEFLELRLFLKTILRVVKLYLSKQKDPY